MQYSRQTKRLNPVAFGWFVAAALFAFGIVAIGLVLVFNGGRPSISQQTSRPADRKFEAISQQSLADDAELMQLSGRINRSELSMAQAMSELSEFNRRVAERSPQISRDVLYEPGTVVRNWHREKAKYERLVAKKYQGELSQEESRELAEMPPMPIALLMLSNAPVNHVGLWATVCVLEKRIDGLWLVQDQLDRKRISPDEAKRRALQVKEQTRFND